MNGCFSAGAVPHTKWVFDWGRDERLFACPTKKGEGGEVVGGQRGGRGEQKKMAKRISGYWIFMMRYRLRLDYRKY